MVQLIDGDIKTREVLDWRGIHIFHAWMSSCSQKLRVYLNHKPVAWQRHELNLGASESYTPWFLGINPRGLVPVLVWDGAVHIESNDIIAHLEAAFPDPCLIPMDQAADIARLLGEEDDLHLDLRTLSFRFVYGRTGSPKTPAAMATYRESGSGTVGGKPDIERRGAEIDFLRPAGAGRDHRWCRPPRRGQLSHRLRHAGPQAEGGTLFHGWASHGARYRLVRLCGAGLIWRDIHFRGCIRRSPPGMNDWPSGRHLPARWRCRRPCKTWSRKHATNRNGPARL